MVYPVGSYGRQGTEQEDPIPRVAPLTVERDDEGDRGEAVTPTPKNIKTIAQQSFSQRSGRESKPMMPIVAHEERSPATPAKRISQAQFNKATGVFSIWGFHNDA